MFTVKEVARRLNVAPNTVRNAMEYGPGAEPVPEAVEGRVVRNVHFRAEALQLLGEGIPRPRAADGRLEDNVVSAVPLTDRAEESDDGRGEGDDPVLSRLLLRLV